MSGDVLDDSPDESIMNDFDLNQEIARSSFGDMLHDHERNQKYYDAIKKAIDKMHSLGKTARVLDIGTGSGLLSMIAVKCKADSVIACEAFAPIGNCAREVLKLNELEDKVTIISKHSTKLTVGENGDLPEKANILVAELFDTELIGEGALKAFSHACRELLEEDRIVIPSFGTMYAQIVESNLAQNWNKIRDIYDDDGTVLVKVPPFIKDCVGSASVLDLQLSQLPIDSFKEICAPQPVFHFDWSGKIPLKFKECNPIKVVAKDSGIAQVVFMWWELAMDPENTITLSCAPYWAHPLRQQNINLSSADIPWRDHWLQAIYFLPKEIAVEAGEELNLISCHDEYSLWFYLEKQLKPLEEYVSPNCKCSLHELNSRTRVAQINNDSYRKKYITFMKCHITAESTILFLGEGFYLGFAAAKFGAKKLIFLEENPILARTLFHFMQANNVTNCEIVQSLQSLETHPDTKDITIILGEPHFSTSILPWDNVKFAHMVKKIRGFLRQNVRVAPQECIIKGIVVKFSNLQKTQTPVEVCHEFDLKPFDNVVQHAVAVYDPKVEPQPLWEYPCIAKSATKILSKLNMYDLLLSPLTHQECLMNMTSRSNYNAFAYWADWSLDGTSEGTVTTGPIESPVIGESIKWDMCSRQGVLFIQPKIMDEFYFRFYFDISSSETETVVY